jgi:DNA replication protein DnaC
MRIPMHSAHPYRFHEADELRLVGVLSAGTAAVAALALARGDGSYAKLLRQLARVDLLILDDWDPEPLIAEQQRDLLEIVEDRYSAGSLIITSQVPIDRWYEIVGNPTLADAILDRFIHNAHRIELKGESLRKQRVAT